MIENFKILYQHLNPKFIPRIQPTEPSLLRSENSNFGDGQRIFCVSKKVLKEEDIDSESYNHLYIMGKLL